MREGGESISNDHVLYRGAVQHLPPLTHCRLCSELLKKIQVAHSTGSERCSRFCISHAKHTNTHKLLHSSPYLKWSGVIYTLNKIKALLYIPLTCGRSSASQSMPACHLNAWSSCWSLGNGSRGRQGLGATWAVRGDGAWSLRQIPLATKGVASP